MLFARSIVSGYADPALAIARCHSRTIEDIADGCECWRAVKIPSVKLASTHCGKFGRCWVGLKWHN